MPSTRITVAALLAFIAGCSEASPTAAHALDTGTIDTSVPTDSMGVEAGDADALDDDADADSGTDAAPTPSTGVAAYVFANNASSPSYTPSAAQSYNASGRAIGITRTTTGTYVVSLDGVDLNTGDIQLTAYGSDARCAVSAWSGTAGTVNVVCRAPTGGLADSMFMLAVIKANVATTARFVAYATANQPSAATYAPEAGRAYNAVGGAIAAARTATGTYSMSFAGLALDDANVQVSALGTDAAHCNVSGVSGSKIEVRCVKGTTPTDTAYTLGVIRAGAESGAKVFGYALTNDSTSNYAPDAAYAWSSSGKPITVYYNGVGKYVLSFAGHVGVGSSGSVKVSSFNAVTHCKVTNFAEEAVWGTGEFLIDVQCFDWAGAPANSRFLALWMK